MEPIEDRAVLITGATDGLGRATAHELASRGASVLVHGRSRERGEATVGELRAAAGDERAHLHLADLSSLAEVRRWPPRSRRPTSASTSWSTTPG